MFTDVILRISTNDAEFWLNTFEEVRVAVFVLVCSCCSFNVCDFCLVSVLIFTSFCIFFSISTD